MSFEDFDEFVFVNGFCNHCPRKFDYAARDATIEGER